MNDNQKAIIVWIMVFIMCLGAFTIITLEISNREIAKDNTILTNQITALEKENTVLHDNTKHYIAVKNEQPFKITHYHSDCQIGNCNTSSLTASGTVPVPYWTVAVDPQVIPLGSYVIIDGRMYLAVDSGVFGNILDICVTYHDEALDLGVDYTNDVYVLTEVRE